MSATPSSRRDAAILVTGGAGYVGSHVVLQLTERGERVVVLDDLSTGHAHAVLGAELVVGDVGDAATVARVLRDYAVDTVLHLAARTIAPESVRDPLRYYAGNTCATHTLLSCCAQAGVSNFVFSSSAAVYGMPASGIAREDTPTAPINPYGASKLMSEWMLRDLAAATGLRYAVLRYFNVAGSDLRGRIGHSTRNATLLIKAACEVATGKRESIAVYGTDFATPDGTGVRDYIHVDDLARAHADALDYLRRGGEPVVLNCGYGRGASVREVLRALERVHGAPIPVVEHPRRVGDPPSLIADAYRIRELLGWAPRCDDIDLIVASSLAWERSLGEQRG
ncbi:UDP-glucose 4-epimerase GalE [Lysobacter enzymogenes]|uniref:UDP-glucose 4-epimerase n=1 Tax=Lysobacter enzymogenes TaxID=69 RepID=A0AAU9AU03_LYSEN|nr:UDP-glucose 4-epimerase GalE [Lysobacter enzymogenes]BAV98007.1 UDP-glucose 4-epimerase [Lysobacter enzymogenes]